ncbi:MAG: hypothetical protein ACOC0J_00755 [Myxococcota bacterium]
MSLLDEKIAQFYMNNDLTDKDFAAELVSGGNAQVAVRALESLLREFCYQNGITDEVLAIAHERKRQIEREGWTSTHDDQEHGPGDLARAGACYAMSAADDVRFGELNWPFTERFKPKSAKRDLERAGALIVAEMQRRKRQE